MDWMTQLDEWAAEYLPDLRILRDEPMSRHTSFRVGGPAKRMAFPEKGEQLVRITAAKEANVADIKAFFKKEGFQI